MRRWKTRHLIIVALLLALPAFTCGIGPVLRDLIRRVEALEDQVATLEVQAAPWVFDGDGNGLGIFVGGGASTSYRSILLVDLDVVIDVDRWTGELRERFVTYDLSDCEGQGYADSFLSGVVFRALHISPDALVIGSTSEYLQSHEYLSIGKDGECQNKTTPASAHNMVPVEEFTGNLGLDFPVPPPLSVGAAVPSP